ncbi:TonB-dependent Receptor Plug Domain [Maribacter sedimenticola]|uniref:TonB-dependent Receptor Plug Domain n=2 Tax=Maribacter sedimenticola TaxID=228956 RepID=A0ABY1SDW8_9FLAO|nr:TonB-dependent Receptor Plug Domain [Maribacter sedimenticola]
MLIFEILADMRKILLPILIASFVLLSFVPYSTNTPLPQKMNELIEHLKYYGHLANERTIVHTDKDYYVKGETIWFRVFMTNGLSNMEKPYSGVAYVEVVNEHGDVVDKRKLKVSDNGAYGDVSITNNWDTGKYYIRAFTKLMLNNEHPRIHVKPIVVQNETNINLGQKNGNLDHEVNIDVRPEGGSFVSGLVAAVGVKAVNGIGGKLADSGVIIDDQDNVVTNFELVSPGYGKAYFTPLSNKSYFLRINSGDQVYEKKLPEVISKGYGLHVKEGSDYIVVRVAGTNEKELEKSVLLAHKGETPLSVYQLGEKSGNTEKLFKIAKKDLGTGIVSFSLFDQLGNAKCQRSLNLMSDFGAVGLTLDKETYRSSEPIRLGIEGADYLRGNVSLSVVSKDRIIENKEVAGLQMSALGNSLATATQMKGSGDLSELQLKEAVDAMMILDNNYKVDWEKIKEFKIDEVVHRPELGIMVSGNVGLKNAVNASKSSVSLTGNGGSLFQESSMTNAMGDFEFGPYVFYDSLNVLVHVNKVGAGKLPKDALEIDIFDTWPAVSTMRSSNKGGIIGEGQRNAGQNLSDKLMDINDEVTVLEEVVVESDAWSEQIARDKEYNKLTPYFSYNNRIVADSLKYKLGAVSALDLLMQTPGVNVSGIYPNQRVLVRGVGTISESIDPLFLINGAPTSADAAKQLLAEEIMFVDVIKGASAAAFGGRGGNGVIAFYTKRGNYNNSASVGPVNWVNATIPGFSKANEFMDYRSKGHINNNGEVLYWAPNVAVKDNSLIEIDTKEAIGGYSIVLQGLDQNGNPLRLEKTIEIIE